MDERLKRTLKKRREKQAEAEAKSARQLAIDESVLAVVEGDEGREAAAQRLGVHPSAMREWVLKKAKEQARARIPDDVMPLLLNADWRDELFNELEGESGSHLPLTGRLAEALRTCVASDAQMRQLFHSGFTETFDSCVGALIMRGDFPVEILLSLIDSDRFLMDIAHGAGPREVLEAVSQKYEFGEPILTLLGMYYCKEQCPVEELLALIREHHNKLERRFLEEIKMSDSRREQVLALFDELQRV